MKTYGGGEEEVTAAADAAAAPPSSADGGVGEQRLLLQHDYYCKILQWPFVHNAIVIFSGLFLQTSQQNACL